MLTTFRVLIHLGEVGELRVSIPFQRDIRDYNILCFTESWLSLDILSPAIEPAGFEGTSSREE